VLCVTVNVPRGWSQLTDRKTSHVAESGPPVIQLYNHHRSFVYNIQTHRHKEKADHATCDLCSNRPHLLHCVYAMRTNEIMHCVCKLELCIGPSRETDNIIRPIPVTPLEVFAFYRICRWVHFWCLMYTKKSNKVLP